MRTRKRGRKRGGARDERNESIAHTCHSHSWPSVGAAGAKDFAREASSPLHSTPLHSIPLRSHRSAFGSRNGACGTRHVERGVRTLRLRP